MVFMITSDKMSGRMSGFIKTLAGHLNSHIQRNEKCKTRIEKYKKIAFNSYNSTPKLS